MRPLSSSLVALSAALVLVGCTASGGATTPTGTSSGSATAVSASTPAASASASVGTTSPKVAAALAEIRRICAPGAGKTVKLADPVPIPAITWTGVSRPESKVGTKTIPAVAVADISIPATAAEPGCTVVYDAPAGCLAKVEISPAVIPDFDVPGYSYTGADGTVHQVAVLHGAGQVANGASAEGVCQPTISKPGVVPAVARGAIARGAIARAAQARGMSVIPMVCDKGACSVPVTIDPLYVPSVYVDSLYVESGYLPFRTVSGQTTAQDSDTGSTYQAPADVLFDYDKADLKDAAKAALDAIIADAASRSLTGKIRVEGHTDDTGDEAYNQALSTKRAQAVADYLTSKGIAATRITVTGRGETSPRYPNDSDEHRALNRRVVLEFNKG